MERHLKSIEKNTNEICCFTLLVFTLGVVNIITHYRSLIVVRNKENTNWARGLARADLITQLKGNFCSYQSKALKLSLIKDLILLVLETKLP